MRAAERIGGHLPMWNEPDTRGPLDELIRDAHELLAEKETHKRKRLRDCTLPEGFRLVTPEPRQFVMDGQLRYGFKLAWGRVDAQGRRGPDEWAFVARFEEFVPAEFQMQWAIDDFQRELHAGGVNIYARGPAPKPAIPVWLTLKVEDTAGRPM